MCIIVIKPKGKDINNKHILKQCYNSNDDGAGYMFINNKSEVEIKKGFMSFDEFYKSVMDDYEKYNLKNHNLVMHFRIGTSGKSATGCTHPFPVSDDYKTMEKLHIKTNIGVCHNGIVSMFNSIINEHSDTQIYIKNVLAPIIKLNVNAYKFEDIQTLIDKTTSSKWCFLNNSDEFYLVGNFVEDNGYYYSNTSYKQVRYTYTPKHDDWYKYSIKTTPTPKAVSIANISAESTKSVSYKPLKKGMAFIGGSRYVEVITDNEYYIDKSYNIYEKSNDKYNKVYNNCIVYKTNNLTSRIDYDILEV